MAEPTKATKAQPTKQLHDRPTELVEISRRERRLRETLLTVDEDLIHDEKRLRRNSERRKERLTRRINKVRQRQEQRLDRRDNSRLYRRSHILFYLTTPFRAIGRGFRAIYRKLRGRVEHHRATTVHRSFYLTTHAQSVRQINIAGYGRFIREVWRLIRDNWRIYLKVLGILTLALLTVIGLGAQSSYVDMRDAIQQVDMGSILTAVSLFTQAVITSVVVNDTNRQAYALLLVVMAWLVLIYIVRRLYAGKRQLRLRDAVYNAGAPIISTLVMLVMILIQLLPLAIALIAYSAVSGAGYINQGIDIENMAAWLAIAAIGVLTIYWMITSLLSLITVTIPGIYPMRAYFETSVQVSGRRVKILLRVLAMLVPLALLWIIILLPVVLLDAAVKFKTFPLVQIVTTLLVAASFIWVATYLYMLYRRILDSPEQPIGTPNQQFVWPWLRKKRAAEIAAASEAQATANIDKGD